MSYLLDALRKSEHERSIGQVPTLEAQPVAGQTPRRNRWVIAGIVFLVIINSGMLLHFFFAEPDSSPRNGTPAGKTNDTPANETVETAHRNVPGKPTPVINPSARTKQPATDAPKSISEMIAAKTKGKAAAAQQQANNVRGPKAPTAKAPAPPITRATSPPPKDSVTVPVKEKSSTRPATTEKAERKKRPEPEIAALRSPPPAPSAGSVGQPAESIPLLRKLPSDFRRKVPTMAINVFVYSERVDERFVIINMAKYRTGDKIENGPLLEAIRPDSVVLRFDGKRFRLKRP